MRKGEGKSYGVKFKINLESRAIIVGYTSDTKYFSDIAAFMAEADILIFNISDIYEKDVRGTKQKNNVMDIVEHRVFSASRYICWQFCFFQFLSTCYLEYSVLY